MKFLKTKKEINVDFFVKRIKKFVDKKSIILYVKHRLITEKNNEI